MNGEIQDLFKIPIYKSKLLINNLKILKYCISLSKKEKSLSKSNIGGFHSNYLQGQHKPLDDLFSNIKKHSNDFVKSIGVKNSLNICEIWFNINKYKDLNLVHNHPNCILSGVYYVQVPKNSGDIKFLNPNAETSKFDWNYKNIEIFNSYTSSAWSMPSNESMLYLFPSWLNHWVEPNLNKKEKRVSISFNLN